MDSQKLSQKAIVDADSGADAGADVGAAAEAGATLMCTLPPEVVRRVALWLRKAGVIAWTASATGLSRSGCAIDFTIDVMWRRWVSVCTSSPSLFASPGGICASRFAIRSLRLLARGVDDGALDAVGRLGASLRTLHIKFAGAAHCAPLRNLTMLTTLAIENWTRLESLRLVPGEELRELILASLPALADLDPIMELDNLAALSLARVGPEIGGVAVLRAIARCASLERLRLGWMPQLVNVDALHLLPTLNALHLDYNDGLVDISALGRCTALTELSIAIGSSARHDATALLDSGTMSRLSSHLGSLSLQLFAPVPYDAIAYLTRLTTLRLLTYGHARATVAPLVVLTQLVDLRLECAGVDESVVVFERLGDLTQLARLTLVVQTLKELPKRMLLPLSGTLTELDLSGCRMLRAPWHGVPECAATLRMLRVNAAERDALEVALARSIRARQRADVCTLCVEYIE